MRSSKLYLQPVVYIPMWWPAVVQATTHGSMNIKFKNLRFYHSDDRTLPNVRKLYMNSVQDFPLFLLKTNFNNIATVHLRIPWSFYPSDIRIKTPYNFFYFSLGLSALLTPFSLILLPQIIGIKFCFVFKNLFMFWDKMRCQILLDNWIKITTVMK
jgi:hypothetical protein